MSGQEYLLVRCTGKGFVEGQGRNVLLVVANIFFTVDNDFGKKTTIDQFQTEIELTLNKDLSERS